MSQSIVATIRNMKNINDELKKLIQLIMNSIPGPWREYSDFQRIAFIIVSVYTYGLVFSSERENIDINEELSDNCKSFMLNALHALNTLNSSNSHLFTTHNFIHTCDVTPYFPLQLSFLTYVLNRHAERRYEMSQSAGKKDPSPGIEDTEAHAMVIAMDYIFYARIFNYDGICPQLAEIFQKIPRLNELPSSTCDSFPKYRSLAEYLIARQMDDENDLSIKRVIAIEWYNRAMATDRSFIEKLVPEYVKRYALGNTSISSRF